MEIFYLGLNNQIPYKSFETGHNDFQKHYLSVYLVVPELLKHLLQAGHSIHLILGGKSLTMSLE